MNEEALICGLSFGCPAINRKDDCPLRTIDSFSFEDKVILIEGLSSEEKDMILEHHNMCSKNRESF